MKKRARLFFTIASLCMTLSMFVFGVYSASQLTYSINGSVSYEVRDVLVTISTKVAYISQNTIIQNPMQLIMTSFTDDKSQDGKYSSYSDNNIVKPGEIDTPTLDVEIDFNKAYAWRMTINIKTINESNVFVSLGSNVNFGIPDDATYSIYEINNNYDEPINSSDLENPGIDFVYYIYITDLTKSINMESFEIPLIIANQKF